MNLLLIAPKIGDIYKDILNELTLMGVVADFIEDSIYTRDYRNIRLKKWYSDFNFNRKLCDLYYTNYWNHILAKEEYSKTYDYILVIDGFRLHHTLFDELRARNPKIICINYLFDSTRSLYHFEENFHYFDKVATFERHDSEKYGLLHLPISWPRMQHVNSTELKMFGMGVYSPIRFKMFDFMSRIAEQHNLKCYIKLYNPHITNLRLYNLKQYIRNILSLPKHISVNEYKSKYITHELLSGESFRFYMHNSEVILDTIAFEQDGLTARCMWALGAGKKIITTNESIKSYDFYTPSQIFVIENYSNETKDNLLKFLDSEIQIPLDVSNKILKLRTDNWLKYLLEL